MYEVKVLGIYDRHASCNLSLSMNIFHLYQKNAIASIQYCSISVQENRWLLSI